MTRSVGMLKVSYLSTSTSGPAAARRRLGWERDLSRLRSGVAFDDKYAALR
jgi:hypothetical protein